jgi:acyl-CoA thioester hydrolase
MKSYSKQVEVRWSDLDPNFHLRHSVYYDWGAFLRLTFLSEHGLTPSVMRENNFGPILFREECVFKREILFGDIVDVNIALSKCRKDFSRLSIVHEIYKNKDTLSAVVTVDVAWIDTNLRKLAVPPQTIMYKTFEAIPQTEDFVWLER